MGLMQWPEYNYGGLRRSLVGIMLTLLINIITVANSFVGSSILKDIILLKIDRR